ncbi:hypothetical protein, partial [Nocardioides sp.]|uniref:hypothetical protein n=1 Tax=Nocardioides sp. TaxID=35761 RepID=UPI0027365890
VLTAEAAAVASAAAEQASGGIGRGSEDIGGLLDVLADHPTYWRTLVNAVLDAPDVAVPGTASTTELFTAMWADTTSVDPDPASTAVAGATVLGWLVFGEFMAEATGADPAEVRRRVAANVAHLAG